MTSREEQAREEARLARRLRDAAPAERAALYAEVYDRIAEMHFSRLGPRPQPHEFVRGASVGLLGPLTAFTEPGDEVLEIGCGAGMLSIRLADAGRKVTGADVSERMLERAREFSGGTAAFVCLDGITLPFADGGFDFAFSVQMFEHLHRDDALDHLREVRRVLRPGGAYFVVTPNGRFGKSQSEQWDVEGVEEDVHLHEWSYGEIRAVAPLCGFDDVRAVRNNDRVQIIPGRLAAVLERLPSQYVAERLGVATLEAVLR